MLVMSLLSKKPGSSKVALPQFKITEQEDSREKIQCGDMDL